MNFVNKKLIFLKQIKSTFLFFFLFCLISLFNTFFCFAGSVNHAFFEGNYDNEGLIGISLPGSWRPFSDESPWNTPISTVTQVHPDSDLIIAFMKEAAANIRFAKYYSIPVWVVNSDNIPLVQIRSKRIFPAWDKNNDGLSDQGVPVIPAMWPEQTSDGHLCIIDPFKKISYEFSCFKHINNSNPQCTTFNIWDIEADGMGDPYFNKKRWQTRGGKGSGFPIIAGLIRPEEIESGEIRHALVFSFSRNRRAKDGSDLFIPPACRSDGQALGRQYPIQGMRFQLNPSLTEKDFNNWKLTKEAKIVARALQKYGMFLGDNGGPMAIQAQLLGPSKRKNLQEWEKRHPGLFSSIKNIPTNQFRIVYTGKPIKKIAIKCYNEFFIKDLIICRLLN
ncbi:MAG: hypothetical protein P9M03_02380 [Candidatus Theseobacter exili]|nr:hypothetical protein [Candidatus Theseobacter exili]